MEEVKNLLFIEADTNDGDYVSRTSYVTDEEIAALMPMIEAIKNFEPYVGNKPKYWTHKHHNNYATGDCYRPDLGEKSAREYYVGGGFVTEEQFQLFDENTPYGENGIHTIEEVKIYKVIEEINLLG